MNVSDSGKLRYMPHHPEYHLNCFPGMCSAQAPFLVSKSWLVESFFTRWLDGRASATHAAGRFGGLAVSECSLTALTPTDNL